jgi:hypothetical protein
MGTMAFNGDQLSSVVTAYTDWHRHSRAVHSAYSAWSEATADEASRRYAAYIEQLDREQRACELYAAVIARARTA